MQARVLSPFHPTRLALFWMHLASEPFVALLTLMGFILKKELGASPLEISILSGLTPVIACFSFYLSTLFSQKSHWLVPNLVVSFFLGRILFLFLPFYCSVPFVIVAALFYQLFNRASTPALMEVIKLSVNETKRSSLISSVYFFNFLESLCLGLFIGRILDSGADHWKWAFFLAALISMTSILFHSRIQIPKDNVSAAPLSKWNSPFICCLELIKKDKSFRIFQTGFMIGGTGLMLMNPALIIFYDQTLHLSHEMLTSARYIWMALGVLLTTFLWEKFLKKETLFYLVALITFGFGLFSIFIFLSKKMFLFFYCGFFIYGVAQAGSHLVWHLSGILFSKKEESSSIYTATNVLMVGVRGLIAPLVGGIMTSYLGPSFTLLVGATLCLSGSLWMILKAVKQRVELTQLS